MLFNRNGSDLVPAGLPGEQWVPPDFTARTLSVQTADFRRLLISDSADLGMLNWRTQELLTCIHACSLDNYLTALDPRITYWPFNNSLMLGRLAGPTAVQSAGSAQTMSIIGDRNAVAPGDQIYFTWTVSLDGNTATIRYTDAAGNAAVDHQPYTIVSGLSTPVPLAGAPLWIQFGNVAGTVWQISWLMQPRTTLATVLAAAINYLTPVAQAQLFGSNPTGPQADFLALWQTSNQPPFQLAGLALAVIYLLSGGGA